MHIVADEAIPYLASALSRLGDVTRLPADQITRGALERADALVVRSVTRVDEELLDGTRVRVVGSATTGLDHVHAAYLGRAGIVLVDAGGANANAVAEYVVAALFRICSRVGRAPDAVSLGIVGLGRIGTRVARYAGALGMRCVVYDPPLGRATAEPVFRTLEEVQGCDVITLHVPLTRDGLDPTYHLVDAAFLEALRPETWLINTARGPVVDNVALLDALRNGAVAGFAGDVWEGEPCPSADLIRASIVATPHIAGHSLDAKIAASRLVFEGVSRALGVDMAWPDDPDVNAIDPGGMNVPEVDAASLSDLLQSVTQLAAYDAALRRTLELDDDARARRFAEIRAAAPTRREFPAYDVTVPLDADADKTATLRALGFRVELAPASATGETGGES